MEFLEPVNKRKKPFGAIFLYKALFVLIQLGFISLQQNAARWFYEALFVLPQLTFISFEQKHCSLIWVHSQKKVQDASGFQGFLPNRQFMFIQSVIKQQNINKRGKRTIERQQWDQTS